MTFQQDCRLDILADQGPHCDLERFWKLESLRILPNENSMYDEFEERISHDGERYVVNLPWREPHGMSNSKRRLMSLLSRLKKEPDILREYESVIREKLDRGIVERVEKPSEVVEVHYLPRHPVISKNKQTT